MTECRLRRNRGICAVGVCWQPGWALRILKHHNKSRGLPLKGNTPLSWGAYPKGTAASSFASSRGRGPRSLSGYVLIRPASNVGQSEVPYQLQQPPTTPFCHVQNPKHCPESCWRVLAADFFRTFKQDVLFRAPDGSGFSVGRPVVVRWRGIGWTCPHSK